MLVEAWIEDGMIADAMIVDTMYRGFEQILEGRPAFDTPYYTQRICGICSSAHAVASCQAIEQALGIQVPLNGLLLRNLILASDFIQNHIRHFYTMCLPDYFRGPDIYPFIPHQEGDIRVSKQEEDRLTAHYLKSLEVSRDAHAAFAVFGGKAPHGHGIVPGGCSSEITADKVNRFRGYLTIIMDFLESHMLPDAELLAEHYPDYVHLGKGNGNFFSAASFPCPDLTPLFSAGALIENQRRPLEEQVITEDVTTAWYKPSKAAHPQDEKTQPDRSQPQGYTWVKAPRYQGQAMEVGPLARAIIAKEKIIGFGAVARLWSRAWETQKIAEACHLWLTRLEPGAESLDTQAQQDSGKGFALIEAMRGTLGHWIRIEKGRVENYQIITPSAWNFSSRDERGNRSVGELSLLRLKVQTPELKEAGRIIRSFDPCFSCSVHLMDMARADSKEFII